MFQRSGYQKISHLHFYDDISGAIARTAIEPNETSIVAIHTGDSPSDLVTDLSGNNLYLATGGAGEIVIYNPNNLADRHILYSYNQTLNGGVYALAIDETRNKIYWVDNLHSRLNVGSLDGKTTPTTLFALPNSGSLNCTGLVINTVTNTIYFTDASSNKIYSADLHAGTLPVELVTTSNYSINSPRDLAISADGNSLYWPDPDNQINVTDLITKKSSVLFNDGMVSLFVNHVSNDIYLSAYNQIFKTHAGAATLSTVFKDQTIIYPKSIISFVVH